MRWRSLLCTLGYNDIMVIMNVFMYVMVIMNMFMYVMNSI